MLGAVHSVLHVLIQSTRANQVMFTMPLHPLTIHDEDGQASHEMWTVASVLALRTPALQFDPTHPADFDGADDVNGLSMLERYVDKLLGLSFAESSLFWHYAMRHVPSESLACAKEEPVQALRNKKINFFNDPFPNEIPDLPNVSAAVPPVPMHGYAAFSIGAASSTCFCGWEKNGATCTIPAGICSDLQLPSCEYAHGTSEVLIRSPLTSAKLP